MAGKATDDRLRNTMQEHVAESERFIAALLNELSSFGDGVAGEVDMDNTFNDTWKGYIQHADTFNNEQVGELVDTLEQILKEQYRMYSALNMEMPASTKELLEKQEKELSQHSVAT
jgi:transcription initiation factor IIE alpha subunit